MTRKRYSWRWDVPRPLWGVLNLVWRVTMLWSITVDGTVTWWCMDDEHQRERKLDWEIRVPRWPWRLYCWWRGHCDESPDGECVFCQRRVRPW